MFISIVWYDQCEILLWWINHFNLFECCRLKTSLRERSLRTRMTPRSLVATGDTPLTQSKPAFKLPHVWLKCLLKMTLQSVFSQFWVSLVHVFLAWLATVVTTSKLKPFIHGSLMSRCCFLQVWWKGWEVWGRRKRWQRWEKWDHFQLICIKWTQIFPSIKYLLLDNINNVFVFNRT